MGKLQDLFDKEKQLEVQKEKLKKEKRMLDIELENKTLQKEIKEKREKLLSD